MSNLETRSLLLRAFEHAREAKGAAHEPDRLLAFLTESAPKGKRVADTFGGRRRYVRFMDTVQLDLGVCFTNEDWERGFGLDDLATLVETKRRNRDAQMRLAEKRILEARASLQVEPIKFGILAAALLALPAARGDTAIRIVMLLLWLAVVATVILVNLKQLRFARALAARIDSEDDRA